MPPTDPKTRAQPQQPTNSYVVPQTVQRSTSPSEVELTADYLARLERRLADPLDALLAWVNAGFAPSPPVYATLAQGRQSARQVSPAVVTAAPGNTLVTRGAVAVTDRLDVASGLGVKGAASVGSLASAGVASASNSLYALLCMTITAGNYSGGFTDTLMPTPTAPYIIGAPLAGSIAAVSVQSATAALSAGTFSARVWVQGAYSGASATVSNSTANSVATFARGAFPYAAGNQLTLRISGSGITAGSNTAMCITVFCWQ